MALNQEPYTSRELIDLLWLWSGELSNVANDVNGSLQGEDAMDDTVDLSAIEKLKLRRVSKEINELLEKMEADNAKAS